MSNNKEKLELLNNPLVWEILQEYYNQPKNLIDYKKSLEEEPQKDWAIESADKDNIYAVKRLRDMVRFEIGDELTIGKLIKIKLTDSKKDVILTTENEDSWLKYAVKIEKKPLFTTFDGVDVFEGYTVYFVNLSTNQINPMQNIGSKFTTLAQYTYFHSKEKAEEYLCQHSPIFSIQDLYELSKVKTDSILWFPYDDLFTASRKKLNISKNS